MDEYIEREALLNEICNKNCGCSYDGDCPNCRLISEVEELPAADVAPVRHGQWEEADWIEPDHKGFELIRTPKAAWRCSKCHHCFKKELLWRDNYCPNCGARMDSAE